MPCICASPLPVLKTVGGGYQCANPTCLKDCDPPKLVVAQATASTSASGGSASAAASAAKPVAASASAGQQDFWTALRVAYGPNTMGTINLLTNLQGELQAPGKNNGGLMYISAVESAAGWFLHGSHTASAGAKPVYFLPWKNGDVVYAERSWYENSVCEYFLTTKLTGCRFSITAKHVLHVAANANRGPDDHRGTKHRTAAEAAVTGKGVLTRRASSSGLSADQGEEAYGGLGLVFGMRVSAGKWVYKVYAHNSKTWDILWE